MKRNAKKVKKTLFKVVVLGIIAYVVFVFINQYVKISQKSDELGAVNERIAAQKDKNEEMRSELESGELKSDGSFGDKNSGTIVFENVME